tara:strand:- start:30 stop:542 length:513 start_codon:yes stop_codon:yes gene_type:complete
MSTWKIVIRAASLASRWHGSQTRNDGTPYFQHPARVATLLARAGADDELVAAGYLHDVIEDTPADYDDIAEALGTRIADWVFVMSKDHRLPEDVREPAYKQQLVDGPWEGRAIKLADQIDNFTASIKSGSTPSKKRRKLAAWALEIAREDAHPVSVSLRKTLQSSLDDYA